VGLGIGPEFKAQYRKKKRKAILPGIVVHTCNLSTQEADAEGWQVPDQYRLRNETLSQREKIKQF
jgi:hypothetical protein